MLIFILGIPLVLVAHVCEYLIPSWQFSRRMKARRPRPHTFA